MKIKFENEILLMPKKTQVVDGELVSSYNR